MLLPIVNVPMIDYTLAWLESAGVEEVFVFCCAHVKQVTEYLETTKWLSQPNFKVSTIESHNCVSAGDALRLIYEKNVVSLIRYLYLWKVFFSQLFICNYFLVKLLHFTFTFYGSYEPI